MHVRPPLARAPERAGERLVLEEVAGLDRAVDPLEVLEEDAPRADRQMADFRVAHLAIREADRSAGCLQRRVRIPGPQPVEHRRLRQLDRVSRPRRSAPPPVENDERYEREAASSQIDPNVSRSSDAPPTSAPATPSRMRRSWQLPGVTDPP